MSEKNIEFIKVNVISVTTLIAVIVIFIQQAQWQKSVEINQENFQAHMEDKILHMPFEKSIEVFVPRVELDGRMNNMQNSLNKIEAKLDKLK